MNIKILILLFLFSIINGCSTPESGNRPSSDLNVVDIDANPNNRTSPEINSTLKGTVVGPETPDHGLKNSGQGKAKVWGLVLSPGLNRVICHAVAVRALYEKGIRFNVVSGVGMGAIVAAYLAKGTTPEIIEWKFHKFFQNTKGMKPFSEKWTEQVKKDLLADFKNKKIQGTKITLLIPVYNNEERKVEYLRRGDLHDKLLKNLMLSKAGKSKYSSTLEKGSLELKNLKDLGIQKIVKINALGRKVKFDKNEDYLFGLYGKLASHLMDSDVEAKTDYQLNLPVDNFSLDTIQELPEYLRVSYLFSRDNSSELVEDFLSGNEN